MEVKRPKLPPAGYLQLPGRGRTWVYDSGRAPAGDASSVVLLHGWTSTAGLNWYRCFGPLSEDRRVVALDHRGHGRGIRSRRPFRLEDCADDVAALIDRLELGPAIVAGYSMGGPVAQLLWRRHPSKVKGLVLGATAARFSVRREFGGLMAVAGYGLSLALSGIPYEARQWGVSYVLRNRTAIAGTAEWAIQEWERNDPAAMIQAGLALGRFDSTPWIGDVNVPTAVLVTTLDTTVSPKRQRRLASLIPGSDTFEVEGTHRACVDEAKVFVPALRAACQMVEERSVRPGGAEVTSRA